jgi:hypothetical protein
MRCLTYFSKSLHFMILLENLKFFLMELIKIVKYLSQYRIDGKQ